MLLAHELKETTPNHRAEPVEVWKARSFIEEHSGEELSLRKVAKAVSISANHLSEKFKQVTGVNFVDYIARTRFEKTCDLLRNSNLRIRSHSPSVFNHCRSSIVSSKSWRANHPPSIGLRSQSEG
jgi:AraC-like DNA-binding protein